MFFKVDEEAQWTRNVVFSVLFLCAFFPLKAFTGCVTFTALATRRNAVAEED